MEFNLIGQPGRKMSDTDFYKPHSNYRTHYVPIITVDKEFFTPRA